MTAFLDMLDAASKEFPVRRRGENDVQYLVRYHQWAASVDMMTFAYVTALNATIHADESVIAEDEASR